MKSLRDRTWGLVVSHRLTILGCVFEDWRSLMTEMLLGDINAKCLVAINLEKSPVISSGFWSWLFNIFVA